MNTANLPAMHFAHFTVNHANMSRFAAVTIRQGRKTRTIANPRALFGRKDGNITLRAADKRHTFTFNPAGAVIVGHYADGYAHEFVITRGR